MLNRHNLSVGVMVLLTGLLPALVAGDFRVAVLASATCFAALFLNSRRSQVSGTRLLEAEAQLQSYRQLDEKIAELLQIVTQASIGNLTGRPSFEGNDMVGQLAVGIKEMMEDLSQLVRRLQNFGVGLARASNAIATQSRAQEQAASDQVDSVLSVLQDSQAMNSVSQDLLSMMRRVSEACDGTARLAQESKKKYEDLRGILTEVQTATRMILSNLAHLGQRADAINLVITTFVNVAHDTNLLSINAAIAAEKAGDFGREFQAVSREIRRMADRNSVSALEIEKTVEELQTAVRDGSLKMQNFTTSMESNATSLVELGTQLVNVGFQVQALSPRFEEAVMGVEAQSRSAHSIVEQIQFVSDIAQQNVLALKASNEALAKVHVVANDLKSIISEYVVEDE